MAAENEVMEIGWIGCRESPICHEDDAIMNPQPVQLLQAVSAIKGWLKETSPQVYFCTRCKEWIKEGDVTENGIEVVQAREIGYVRGQNCTD